MTRTRILFAALPLAVASPEDAAAALAPCPGHEIIGIIGPAKSLKSNLEELGAPVVQVEWRDQDGWLLVDVAESAQPRLVV